MRKTVSLAAGLRFYGRTLRRQDDGPGLPFPSIRPPKLALQRDGQRISVAEGIAAAPTLAEASAILRDALTKFSSSRPTRRRWAEALAARAMADVPKAPSVEHAEQLFAVAMQAIRAGDPEAPVRSAWRLAVVVRSIELAATRDEVATRAIEGCRQGDLVAGDVARVHEAVGARLVALDAEASAARPLLVDAAGRPMEASA